MYKCDISNKEILTPQQACGHSAEVKVISSGYFKVRGGGA